MSRRAISPVIATVIIVAVAIAISIAVAGWLFGLWGGLASGTPQIQVSSVTVKTDGTTEIYIVNQGSGADEIIKIELNDGQNTYTLTPDRTSIEANFKGWVTATPSPAPSLTVGQSVTVKIYFQKSGTVTIPATVSG